MCFHYETRDEFGKSMWNRCDISERDGKIFFNDNNGIYEVVVYEGEREEWADGNWHHEFEDPEILEEFKKGLKILKNCRSRRKTICSIPIRSACSPFRNRKSCVSTRRAVRRVKRR